MTGFFKMGETEAAILGLIVAFCLWWAFWWTWSWYWLVPIFVIGVGEGVLLVRELSRRMRA